MDEASSHLSRRVVFGLIAVRAVGELHVTGVQKDATGRWRDSMPLTPAGWTTIEWVLEQIRRGVWPRPWVVALEYGGPGPGYEWRSHPGVIAEQLPTLRALVEASEHPLSTNE